VLILKSAIVNQTSLFQLSSYDNRREWRHQLVTRKGRGKGRGRRNEILKSKRQERDILRSKEGPPVGCRVLTLYS
jgi:hypothetical protein